jgi:TonB family protein
MTGRVARVAVVATLLSSASAHAEETSPPVVLHAHQAPYPEAAYPQDQAPRETPVTLELLVTIDTLGHVIDATVARSGGDAFDHAALRAVRTWHFAPGKRNGKAVVSRIRVPFSFAPIARDTGPQELPAATLPSEAAPVVPPAPPPPPPPEEVRVVGFATIPSRGAGDHEIPIGKLATVPRNDAAGLLRLAPGVLLTNEGGTGHPYQIYLRGFDAREGQDIEFQVNGMPFNEVGNVHGNGLADTNFIIPELVRSLRVIEGPFAPQQGNFAVAGSALYDLGLSEAGFTAKATYGSFGTKRLLLTYRPASATEHTFGGAELMRSDGFGQNRNSERVSAISGYEGNLGKTATFRVLATSYATHYAQAGLLRQDDVESGRKGFYDTYDTQQGGDAARHSLGVTVYDRVHEAKVSQSAFLVLRDFRLRNNLTGFQADPQQTWQSVHPQRGDLIDQTSNTVTLGGRGSARQPFEFLGRKHEVEFGYLGRVDLVESAQRRNRLGTIIPYRTDLALNSALTNVGVYADANVRPSSWLTLRGGVRGDLFHYRVRNLCAQNTQASFGGDPIDTDCFASDRQGYRSPEQTATTSSTTVQPRGTVIVGPTKGFSFSASVGKGSRSLDPQYINQGLETPYAEVTAQEAGVAYARSLRSLDLLVRSVFFQTHVDRDLFFNQTEGRNTLANGTTRTGWAGNARATGAFYDIAANLTFVRAIFDDTKLVIPYAPGVIARLDGALFGSLPIAVAGRRLSASLGTGLSFIGSRPLPLGETSQTQLLLDAGAQLRYREITLGLMGTNLLGRQYRMGEYNYVSDFRSQAYPTLVASRHFSAGEPTAVYATLAVTLGGADQESQP